MSRLIREQTTFPLVLQRSDLILFPKPEKRDRIIDAKPSTPNMLYFRRLVRR